MDDVRTSSRPAHARWGNVTSSPSRNRLHNRAASWIDLNARRLRHALRRLLPAGSSLSRVGADFLSGARVYRITAQFHALAVRPHCADVTSSRPKVRDEPPAGRTHAQTVRSASPASSRFIDTVSWPPPTAPGPRLARGISRSMHAVLAPSDPRACPRCAARSQAFAGAGPVCGRHALTASARLPTALSARQTAPGLHVTQRNQRQTGREPSPTARAIRPNLGRRALVVCRVDPIVLPSELTVSSCRSDAPHPG